MRRSILVLIIVVLALIIFGAWRFLTVRPVSDTPPVQFGQAVDYLTLPSGFKAEVFWDGGKSVLSTPGVNAGLPAVALAKAGPRLMAFSDDAVFVSLTKQGMVIALEDKDQDGRVENEKVVMDGLNNPHGLAFSEGWLYIAEEDKIIRFKDVNNDNVADLETLQIIVPDLPSGDGHFTRTIKIVNGKLFVSIGSSCNVCREEDEQRASIQQCDLDGKNCKLFAKGLRNTVDFVEFNGKIYGTDNGRDMLGSALPPDEINLIEEGRNFGWPICYGQNIHDDEFDKNVYIRNPCMDFSSGGGSASGGEAPALIDLPAHIAPLGLEFYRGNVFPKAYQGKLFIAYHGSWNAEPPVGYKVVMADVATKEVTDFITGFKTEDGKILGRPVGILNFRDGLLISDDTGGKIYRVTYQP